MKYCKNRNMEEISSNSWKINSKRYLKELQAFLDKAENIENEELRKELILQMLKCDKELTDLAEEMFIKYYKKGKEDLKENR